MKQQVEELSEKANKLERHKHYLKNSEEGSDIEWYNKIVCQKVRVEMMQIMEEIRLLLNK